MGALTQGGACGSAGTSVNSTRVPRLFTWAVGAGLIGPGSTVLDYGCGRWTAPVRAFLEGAGVAGLDQWDPNWHPDADYVPFEGYGAVCLSNVLNVIGTEEGRLMALKAAWDAVRPGGVMLVTVYEADGSGASGPSKAGCWQERRRLASYVAGELSDYGGRVVPGTRLWVSSPKPGDGGCGAS